MHDLQVEFIINRLISLYNSSSTIMDYAGCDTSTKEIMENFVIEFVPAAINQLFKGQKERTFICLSIDLPQTWSI